MKQVAVFLLVSVAAVLADEDFHGSGFMRCYGDMSISMFKDDVEGMVDCQPSWGSPSAPPQGIIADVDGEHVVTVDDKGYGDCTGAVHYVYGDLNLGYCDRIKIDDGKQTRLFCGYGDCTGAVHYVYGDPNLGYCDRIKID